MKACTRARARLIARVVPLAVLTSSLHAFGQVDSWTNPSGGTYSANGNWSENAPPGSSGTAGFALSDTYTVKFTANASPGGLLVENGSVTFNLGGKQMTSVADLAAATGKSATLSVGNGTLSGNAVIGDSGGTGELDVTAGGHFVDSTGAPPSGTVWVGSQTTGTLTFSGGATGNLDNLSVAVPAEDPGSTATGN